MKSGMMFTIKRNELNPRPQDIGSFFYTKEDGTHSIKSVVGESVLNETETILEYTKSALESLTKHAEEKRNFDMDYIVDSILMDYETTDEKHVLRFTMLGHENKV